MAKGHDDNGMEEVLHPLVSVLVVSYKNTEGLYRTIKSVCDQTYPNIELIISDDGTPGFEKEISSLKGFANSCNCGNVKRIVFNSIVQNVGTVRNLNAAIKLSSGKYIKTLAAEDSFSHQDSLRSYVHYAEESGFRVVFAKIRGVTPSGGFVYQLSSCESDYQLLKTYSVKDTLNRLYAANFLPGVGEFINSELFDTVGLFPEEVKLIEDYPYWLKLSLQGVSFGYIDEVLVDYKLSGVSSSGMYSEAFMRDMMVIYDTYIFPNDKRYGLFQGLYNRLKRAGLNYYMNRAKALDSSDASIILVRIKYAPFFLYEKVNAFRFAIKNGLPD